MRNLPSFFTLSITRIRPKTVTERGSTFADWSNTKSKNINNCHVQQRSTTSDFSDRAESDTVTVLWAPYDADIKKGDRIDTGTGIYDVVGEPFIWESPTGTIDHIEVRIEKWVG